MRRLLIKGTHVICMMALAFQLSYGQDLPLEFEFNQSSLQVFHYFENLSILEGGVLK